MGLVTFKSATPTDVESLNEWPTFGRIEEVQRQLATTAITAVASVPVFAGDDYGAELAAVEGIELALHLLRICFSEGGGRFPSLGLMGTNHAGWRWAFDGEFFPENSVEGSARFRGATGASMGALRLGPREWDFLEGRVCGGAGKIFKTDDLGRLLAHAVLWGGRAQMEERNPLAVTQYSTALEGLLGRGKDWHRSGLIEKRLARLIAATSEERAAAEAEFRQLHDQRGLVVHGIEAVAHRDRVRWANLLKQAVLCLLNVPVEEDWPAIERRLDQP